MNPLSPHPPRTPRTSIVSPGESYIYGSDLYSSASSTQEERHEKPAISEEPVEEEEVAEEVPEEQVNSAAVKRVKAPEVWREVLKSSSGRDKAFVSPMHHLPNSFLTLL